MYFSGPTGPTPLADTLSSEHHQLTPALPSISLSVRFILLAKLSQRLLMRSIFDFLPFFLESTPVPSLSFVVPLRESSNLTFREVFLLDGSANNLATVDALRANHDRPSSHTLLSNFVLGVRAFVFALEALVERIRINFWNRDNHPDLPNVKDEPRPWLARRVHRDDLDSDFSFEDA